MTLRHREMSRPLFGWFEVTGGRSIVASFLCENHPTLRESCLPPRLGTAIMEIVVTKLKPLLGENGYRKLRSMFLVIASVNRDDVSQSDRARIRTSVSNYLPRSSCAAGAFLMSHPFWKLSFCTLKRKNGRRLRPGESYGDHKGTEVNDVQRISQYQSCLKSLKTLIAEIIIVDSSKVSYRPGRKMRTARMRERPVIGLMLVAQHP